MVEGQFKGSIRGTQQVSGVPKQTIRKLKSVKRSHGKHEIGT